MSFLLNEEGAMERLVEVLLFASDQPLTVERIRKILTSVPESGFETLPQSSMPQEAEGGCWGPASGGSDVPQSSAQGGCWGPASGGSAPSAELRVPARAPEGPRVPDVPRSPAQGGDRNLTAENVEPSLLSGELPGSRIESSAPAQEEAVAQDAQSQNPAAISAVKPIGRAALRALLERKIEEAVKILRERYSRGGSPVVILDVAGGWQLASNPQYAPWVKRLHKDRTTFRLSSPALETLAIIAYKQPITRAEVEDIRGVESIAALETLLERDLVKTAGRKETVGRPILYATTNEFLRQFGLCSLEDMPLPEIPEDHRGDQQSPAAEDSAASP
ncbi:MAG: SMC-Scp complex subunit ScpB [Elusimicrobia bacterium]|nr:SMC-Scp complex subunit ScpB [Elusimicrobiota bacterium]